jgi:hypothetical protein
MVMKTPTVLAAAAALIVGDAARAASLESTSATTTYHSMTVDGVAVFYREAGPKDAPTLVLCTGFPPPRVSSTRSFPCSPQLWDWPSPAPLRFTAPLSRVVCVCGLGL